MMLLVHKTPNYVALRCKVFATRLSRICAKAFRDKSHNPLVMEHTTACRSFGCLMQGDNSVGNML